MLGTVSAAGEFKTVAYIAAIQAFTGTAPEVERRADYNRIVFTGAQKKTLQALIEKQLEREPGEVRVDVESVINPIILKRSWPFFAGAFAAGIMAAWLFRRSK